MFGNGECDGGDRFIGSGTRWLETSQPDVMIRGIATSTARSTDDHSKIEVDVLCE